MVELLSPTTFGYDTLATRSFDPLKDILKAKKIDREYMETYNMKTKNQGILNPTLIMTIMTKSEAEAIDRSMQTMFDADDNVSLDTKAFLGNRVLDIENVLNDSDDSAMPSDRPDW